MTNNDQRRLLLLLKLLADAVASSHLVTEKSAALQAMSGQCH